MDNCCGGNACRGPAGRAVSGDAPSAQGGDVLDLRIANMDCPTEEALIRDKLSTVPGVGSLEFNLMERRLRVSHAEVDRAVILQALRDIGMDATVVASEASPEARRDRSHAVSRRQWWMMAAAGASATLAEIVAWVSGSESFLPVVALALIAIASGGFETYKKGWIALRNRNLNINALMSVAVTGAALIGQWPEAAMVMFLFALAELIEALSLDRARNAIRKLMAMAPETATVQQADGGWKTAPAAEVEVGAIVRIRPGERVPLDGRVTGGRSSVNQAPITGESMPVEKSAGDLVFAGTINETGSFTVRVTATATHSTLARIIKAVEEAQSRRAPTQRFVDRFAKIYTPTVFAIAVLVAIVPPLALGLAWVEWIYKALVLLVIACPCALVISTPVTIVSGLAAAARRGILIKGGVYLEQGAQLEVVAFDKTGTITHGRPVVTDVIPLVDGAERYLPLAASLAAHSDHPVSAAIAGRYRDRSQAVGVADMSALAGRGIKGWMQGRWFHLGNHRLAEEARACSEATEAALRALEVQGKTAVVLLDEKTPVLVIGVADTVRAGSQAAVDALHQLGLRTMMLTGDNPRTADAIAGSVKIDDVRANLLPEDKLQAIEQAQSSYGLVAMIGDGINDAPALAKADIGIAMGAAGSDTAIETADVALMDDDLRELVEFVQLGRKTRTVLKQNIGLSLGIKAVFFVLALTGQATLWMAVFADMGASLLVVFNGLRLLKFAPGRRSKDDTMPEKAVVYP